MANYYIDYENVHNEGLNGIELLDQGDKVTLFYSDKADTLKIDVVQLLMGSFARIEFVKIVNGVENALDFQLITALMCNYDPENRYYIISKDRGYDAAIEMAGKMQREAVYRCRDIASAIKHQNNLGIDLSEPEVIVDLDLTEPETETADNDEPLNAAVTESVEAAAVEALMEAAIEDELEVVKAETQELEDIGRAELAGEIEPAADNTAELSEVNGIESEDSKNSKTVKASKESKKTKRAKSATKEIKEVDAVNVPEREETAEAAEAAETEPDTEERQRRAYQSICSKLMNNIKNNFKININYKEAGIIYEAFGESEGKMQFYHKLIQKYGKKKGVELYQRVKPAYKSSLAIYKASLEADK